MTGSPQTEQPKRIQRKSGKGSRLPDGAVYVGRPTHWANPFTVTRRACRGAVPGMCWSVEFAGVTVKEHFQSEARASEVAVDLYRGIISGIWNPSSFAALSSSQYSKVHAAVEAWRARFDMHPTEAAWSLRRYDLACWCPLNQPCHADVLLEIANGGSDDRG